MKVFNKPEEARRLHLDIIDCGKDAIIKVDIKDIPKDKSIEEFITDIKELGIAIVNSDETV